MMMLKWIESKCRRDNDINELELTKRRAYGCYLIINCYKRAGCKDVLGLS